MLKSFRLLVLVLVALVSGCAGEVSPLTPCDDSEIHATPLPAGACAYTYDPTSKGRASTWSGLECPAVDAPPTPALWYDAEPLDRTLYTRAGAAVVVSDDCDALYWFQSTGDY